MGLIRAAVTATGSTIRDQWKEFFYCEAIPQDVLVVKGQKSTGKRSSNRKRNDSDIITDGSGIAVADGQCMIIVEQGKVVELCAEPGEFTYDSSTEPSIFCGDLSEGIRRTFETIGKRFTYGGDAGKDQRVYYFNTKELMDNKFGTPTPIPFRIVDHNIGLDLDVSVRCSGVYSYRITDPLLFYTNVCGNVSQEYRRSDIETQLKTEFISALQPAFAKLSEMQIRPNALPGHSDDLCDAMNEALTKKWGSLRGLSVVSVAMNPITLTDEDAKTLKQMQKSGVMRDATMAAATLTEAQADAMRMAASNNSGAMTGFMGMGMANNAGGINAQELYALGAQQKKQKEDAAKASGWKCICGAVNNGNFCTDCGKPKPEIQGWSCACGERNLGNFCTQCGRKRPAAAPLYRCDKCGWQPEDPQNPPKFCPECGDVFDENDIE